MRNLILACIAIATTSSARVQADSLPGARPVIDASQFGSIQSAFDAIPAEGGIVRLPAGDFEISEPLRLQRGDVRIEGAGSATNIINRNEDGRAALMVQHADGAAVKNDIVVSANQFEENQDALHCIDSFNLCMTGNCVDDHLDRGVLIENTYGSVLSGNMIEECAGTAVTLDRDCYGITIGSNVIAHNGAGVDLKDAHGCAVSANTFTIMKDFAMRISEGSGRITVTGNNFCNSYTGEGKVRREGDDLAAGGLVLQSTTAISLTGNIFSGLSTKAVTEEGTNTKFISLGNGAVDTEDDRE